MQSWIDHIAAAVIGASILLILAALSMRTQDSTVEAAQVALGKAELRSLIDIIEQDFNNMGSGMTFPNENAANRVITHFGAGTSADAGYTVLQFYALQNNTGTPDTVLVKYRWRQQGTVTLPNGSTVDAFEVERSDAGGGTAPYTNVTGFSLALRTKEFAAIPAGSINLHDARYVDVNLAMVSPIGVEGLIEQTRWTKQFRPLNLNPEGRRVVEAACFPVGTC